MNISEENERELQAMRENFKALREAKGWSLEALSEISGVAEKILADMEAGQDFEVDYLFTLCRIYGMEPYKIFLGL